MNTDTEPQTSNVQEPTPPKPRRRPPPASLANLRPFRRGVSPNPGGRPARHEVTKLARRHTKTAIQTLADLLKNDDAEIRRRAALALLHEGFGLPPTSQEVIRPSTTVNVGQLNMGAQLSPETAYALMCSGAIAATADHPAFGQRVIEHEQT